MPEAERAGFEPAFPFGKHALQACALNRTTRPLHGIERRHYTRNIRRFALSRTVLYKNTMLVQGSIVLRALVDPIHEQLDLRRRELGAALGHFLSSDQFHQKTIGSIPRNDHQTIIRASHDGFIRKQVQTLLGLHAAMAVGAAVFQDRQNIVCKADRRALYRWLCGCRRICCRKVRY